MAEKDENIDRGDELNEDQKNEGLREKAEELKDKEEDKKVDEDENKLDLEDEELEEEERKALDKKRAKDEEERIPKSRFDRALFNAQQREKQLMDRVTQLEAQVGKEDPGKELTKLLDDKEKKTDQYEEFLLDGKKDDARRIRRELNALQDKIDDFKAQNAVHMARQSALESTRYEAALSHLEAQYPEMNPDSSKFDPDVEKEVLELMNGLIAKGKSAAEALKKAAKYVLGEPQKLDSKAAEEEAAKRRTAALKKKDEVNKKQPPNSDKVGADSDKMGKNDTKGLDILNMNQEQFARLTEEQKAELRGDSLE